VDTNAIVNSIKDHALTLGVFEEVNGHEALSPPGNGLSGGVWFIQAGPAEGQSGLDSTTAYVVFNFRIYSSAEQQPADGIDPAMVDAMDLLITGLSGDFELGSNVRNIDLLGSHGPGLSARSGWLPIPDGPTFRIIDITIPLVINDAWAQVA
jgi:hypothetical protein